MLSGRVTPPPNFSVFIIVTGEWSISPSWPVIALEERWVNIPARGVPDLNGIARNGIPGINLDKNLAFVENVPFMETTSQQKLTKISSFGPFACIF